MSEGLKKIDHSAMTANQYVIILLNIGAFVFNLPWLAALVAAALLLGTILGMPGFGFIYQLVLKPLKLLKPRIINDHPEPHRFSQALGGIFMLAGSLALFGSSPLLGWGLVWTVTALAVLNAFGGFCVGCFIYYWLTRIGVPGFSKTPPPGLFPGTSPTE